MVPCLGSYCLVQSSLFALCQSGTSLLNALVSVNVFLVHNAPFVSICVSMHYSHTFCAVFWHSAISTHLKCVCVLVQ